MLQHSKNNHNKPQISKVRQIYSKVARFFLVERQNSAAALIAIIAIIFGFFLAFLPDQSKSPLTAWMFSYMPNYAWIVLFFTYGTTTILGEFKNIKWLRRDAAFTGTSLWAFLLYGIYHIAGITLGISIYGVFLLYSLGLYIAVQEEIRLQKVLGVDYIKLLHDFTMREFYSIIELDTNTAKRKQGKHAEQVDAHTSTQNTTGNTDDTKTTATTT